MSENKHPHGPWLLEYDEFDEALHITSDARKDAGMVPIATVSVGFKEPFESEQQAAARLIVAVPDMLAAAERVKQLESVLEDLDAVATEIHKSIAMGGPDDVLEDRLGEAIVACCRAFNALDRDPKSNEVGE